MPKDYAKRKPATKKRSGASRGKDHKPVPVTLWLVTLLLVGSGIAGLVYLKMAKTSPSPEKTTQAAPVKSDKKSTKNVAKTSQPLSDDKVPFYDVHHDLTNKKVEIAKEDLQLPENFKKYFYTMPCGSFRERERADELKAKIAMVGSNSELSSVQSKGETWYRVQLGPYNSKRTAEKTRHRLEDNGIHGCLINPHLKPD